MAWTSRTRLVPNTKTPSRMGVSKVAKVNANSMLLTPESFLVMDIINLLRTRRRTRIRGRRALPIGARLQCSGGHGGDHQRWRRGIVLTARPPALQDRPHGGVPVAVHRDDEYGIVPGSQAGNIPRRVSVRVVILDVDLTI